MTYIKSGPYMKKCTYCGQLFKKTRFGKLCKDCWSKSRNGPIAGRKGKACYLAWKREIPRLKHIWVCKCGGYKNKYSIRCIDCSNNIKKISGGKSKWH